VIWTSCFKIAGREPNAVAISRGIPRGWRGRRYLDLAPRWEMLKMSPEDYLREYEKILARLDPVKVAADLDGSIMLCFEQPGVRCHRLYISRWLHDTIGLKVPEWEPSAAAQPRLFALL
jgi:hypothetical protein